MNTEFLARENRYNQDFAHQLTLKPAFCIAFISSMWSTYSAASQRQNAARPFNIGWSTFAQSSPIFPQEDDLCAQCFGAAKVSLTMNRPLDMRLLAHASRMGGTGVLIVADPNATWTLDVCGLFPRRSYNGRIPK